MNRECFERSVRRDGELYRSGARKPERPRFSGITQVGLNKALDVCEEGIFGFAIDKRRYVLCCKSSAAAGFLRLHRGLGGCVRSRGCRW